MGKTNTRNYSEFEKTLGKEVTGYNNRKYSLYELSLSANDYQGNHNSAYRELIQKKYSKIYNCESETIPANLLEEVYGLSESFKEIWREVPDNKKYTVSNLGRIKLNGILVHQDDNNFNGYLKMTKTVEGKDSDNRSENIYIFVAKAFFSNYKEGMHVHHINNNGYDCRPENLILLEKGQHSIVHNFPVSKLTEDPNYGQ
ncbi:HNH endonuclease [Treponema succinifaciens]|uniref:HNH endonuclease n=1 Tax=Treponema succinifaciens TaxID=167 RepID=UPI0023F1FEB8|nr:HNH endonuclease [Treponema succinifaciens]